MQPNQEVCRQDAAGEDEEKTQDYSVLSEISGLILNK